LMFGASRLSRRMRRRSAASPTLPLFAIDLGERGAIRDRGGLVAGGRRPSRSSSSIRLPSRGRRARSGSRMAGKRTRLASPFLDRGLRERDGPPATRRGSRERRPLDAWTLDAWPRAMSTRSLVVIDCPELLRRGGSRAVGRCRSRDAYARIGAQSAKRRAHTALGVGRQRHCGARSARLFTPYPALRSGRGMKVPQDLARVVGAGRSAPSS